MALARAVAMKLPGVAVRAAWSVSVLVALAAFGAVGGAKVPVTPAGRPSALNVTRPVKSPSRTTVTVTTAVEPRPSVAAPLTARRMEGGGPESGNNDTGSGALHADTSSVSTPAVIDLRPNPRADPATQGATPTTS